MIALTVLLAAAALAFGVARFTSIPSIPLLILAGFLASIPLDLDSEILGDALILGVAVLVFVAGVELNPQRIGRQRKAALSIGVLQFGLLGGVGVGAGMIMGLDLEGSLYLGLALTASSTLVAIRVLQQRQQLFEPVGRMVTGVLLLQDLLIILLIPVVTRLPEGTAAVLQGVGGTLALVALTGIALRWGAPFALRRLAFDEESLLLLVMSFLFGFMGLAWWMDLPLVSGAFLAGVALSAFPVSAQVSGQLSSMSHFFNALFFTALGAFLPIPGSGEIVQALALAALVVTLTPIIVAVLAERFGLSARPALGGGLVLAQTSEFSLVVGLQAVAVGQMSDSIFSVIVWVTVLTMTLTPFLARDGVAWALLRLHPTRRRRKQSDPPSGHILLIGCGRSGMQVLESLMPTTRRIVVLEEDPAIIDELRGSEVEAIRGDAGNPDSLEDAGVRNAQLVISTLRRARENAPLLDIRPQTTPTFVRAFETADAEWARARGATPVLFSEAGADEFIVWFREEFR